MENLAIEILEDDEMVANVTGENHYFDYKDEAFQKIPTRCLVLDGPTEHFELYDIALLTHFTRGLSEFLPDVSSTTAVDIFKGDAAVGEVISRAFRLRMIQLLDSKSYLCSPADQARQKIWFGFLNFDESTFLNSKAVVCSEHFDPSDITLRSNGIKYLSPGTLPKLYQADLFQERQSSSESRLSFSSEDIVTTHKLRHPSRRVYFKQVVGYIQEAKVEVPPLLEVAARGEAEGVMHAVAGLRLSSRVPIFVKSTLRNTLIDREQNERAKGTEREHIKISCKRIDNVQLKLQDPRMNFGEAFHDLESLATELAEI
ncbi:hypothetical protein HUJ05_001855 [Dendroctonus ponderosae]|nr:hypothetical protein HUJ05_001855 [Dendroctonus ponderosae]